METTRKPTKLGDFVRTQRKMLSLTQMQLSRRLTEQGFAYSEPAIANWEAGRGVMPLAAIKNGIKFLDALAYSLNVSPVTILEAAGYIERDEIDLAPETIELARAIGQLNPTQRGALTTLIFSMKAGAS